MSYAVTSSGETEHIVECICHTPKHRECLQHYVPDAVGENPAFRGIVKGETISRGTMLLW